MLTDLTGHNHTNPTPMAQDNVACEQWTRNPHNHAKQKHIARAELTVRELVADKTASIHLVSTQQQLSDILTKPLAAPAHKRITDQLMGYSKLAQASTPAAPFAPHAARTTPHQTVPPKPGRAVRK